MQWTIDRVEGAVAVVDAGGVLFDVPLEALPEGAREGWRLKLQRDEAAEGEAKAQLQARVEALMADDDGDDFEL